MITSVSAETILILSPTFNDAAVAVEVLEKAGFSAVACRNMTELCDKIRAQTWGAAIISEEALTIEGMKALQSVLDTQETWSDLPILLLTNADVVRASEVFAKSGNISLLERPFSRLTFIRSAEVALRARRKQYEVRQLLSALNKSKEDAENANQAKTQFLANMSHEIRTPIGAIIGFTEIMKDTQSSEEENAKFMGIIHRNSQHLLRLIDDILDLSKVEAGKMAIEQVEFSFTEFLLEFKSYFAFKAAEKNIQFDCKIIGAIPEKLNTDPVRLKQILANVVGNAIKFTHVGGVTLFVEFQFPHLVFTVQDTGVGISPEQATKLFQPFSQADSSTTRKFGGTGLGLVLSRKLAQLLGGELVLEQSAPDQGATFVIRVSPHLPENVKLTQELSTKDSKGPTEMPVKMLNGMKILIAEDSIDNQELFSWYLQTTGAHIEVVSDGAQAVDTASSKSFDVVLMDIQMPEKDGHQATRELRKSHFTKPIIALTAHAMNDERIRCFESGFTDFLTKPISRDRLLQVLYRYRML